MKNKDWIWGYLLILPTVAGLIILNIYPIGRTFFMSFTQSSGFGKFKWIGLANYKRLAGDTLVWESVGNTLLFTVIYVSIGLVLGVIIAGLIISVKRGQKIFRTIYFIPLVVAPAAVAILWRWLFNADYGLINYLFSLINIAGPRWLTTPGLSITSISMVAIWSELGYSMVILMAGLQDIPESYYEAAHIDGASEVRKFISISLPLLTPSLFFLMVTNIMKAVKQFDLVYMMIDKMNPALEKTQTLLYLFYGFAFERNEKGYASSIVLLAFIIIMIITFLQFQAQKRWVHYE
ncbi:MULTISPECIES: carbohydrate ABC transporter permease [unclassified Oceanispirochaeta]|uniref:carbohydrate ABC transporter permease n=1 Tax=unclassified Oceanispirochaeta TaxID=2635722 RepID=UPI000E092D2F|nr:MULTISPECIES: sugar ABC transporter permease [unclassified Oceanispirochaeta]MBF9018641.1 sugar ABC transporter permease [Oceanispirochaeta sp. M2]NPD75078.1 sugar ABC transporter permease [Oceanispirochaeta sp. M1]RDG29065.1 sugar ABC transporter permease [Oceanispirochaeta sp. M1]